jgi:hypothetical protein
VTAGRPRLSRDDLRALFIEAGRTIVREEGLRSIGKSLTFKRASERIEAETGLRPTNASVIGRVWQSLSDYQTDVLVTFAADYSSSDIDETLRAMGPVLANLDTSTEESRRSSLREMCRVASATHIDALRHSRDLFIWIGVFSMAAVGDASEHQRRLEAAVVWSYEATTEHMERIYASMIDLVGYRLRPDLTMRQFTNAAAALTEGCVMRERVDAPHMNGIKRATGQAGEEQEWTLIGVAVNALAQEFFELDSDWLPPAAGGQ